jgi:threonine dehydratase
MKIVIEASSAVPLACVLEGTLAVRGLRVGIVLSGGNVDLDELPWQRRTAPAAPAAGG